MQQLPSSQLSNLPGEKACLIRSCSSPRETDEDGANEAVEEIKILVRKAMRMLEEGKHVATFNLLKRVVDS